MKTAKNKAESELQNGFRFYRTTHRGRGWQAVITVRNARYFKYFSDAQFGSAEVARQAAELFASQNIQLHEELIALRRRFELRRNSRSGIPGVSRYQGDSTHGPFWLAYWDDRRGRRVSQRFSIGRLGETKALALAIKAREKGVRPFRERYERIIGSVGLLRDEFEGEQRGRRG